MFGGGIGAWFYEDLAGLRVHGGGARIEVRPRFDPARLTWVRASHVLHRGMLSIEWNYNVEEVGAPKAVVLCSGCLFAPNPRFPTCVDIHWYP